jgi:hypothetical protein
MSKQADEKSQRDRAGIVIAAVCFVHCIAGPVLLSVAGLASVIGVSERLEPVFLLGSLAMGALALVPAYRKKHGRISCLAMFGCGILCLILRHQIHWRAMPIQEIGTGTGALLIVGAHALNLKYSKRCQCCEQSAITSSETASENCP